MQAAIAATYAKAESSEAIDWPAILEHYDQLLEMTASPVVALNRAVVVVKVHGAEAALAALAPLEGHAVMRGYHLLPAVRGRVLAELGLEKAREKASRYRALLSEGIDPSEVEQVVGLLPPDRSLTTWLRTQALEERQKARYNIARAELLERALAVIKRES